MVAWLRGLGDSDLCIGVKGAVAARGRNHDRAVVFHAEDLGADVDLADVDEPPRPQLEFAKTVAIATQSDFVIDAGGHVTEMRRRNVLFHDRLEVENVKRLRRVGDQFIEVARGPIHRIRWPQSFRQGVARKQRARRQKLQQATAAGYLKVLLRHRGPLQCDGMTRLTFAAGSYAGSGRAAATIPIAPAGFMASTIALGMRIVAPRSLVVS